MPVVDYYKTQGRVVEVSGRANERVGSAYQIEIFTGLCLAPTPRSLGQLGAGGC